MFSLRSFRQFGLGACAMAALLALCAPSFLRAFSQEQSYAAPPAGQSPVRSPLSMRLGVEILTPTEGVDFEPITYRLLAVIKRNWYAFVPEPALMGKKGRVSVLFHIQHDGTLLADDPKIELGSANEALDKVALAAIRASAPFEHLPASFRSPNIALRAVFLYNLPLDALSGAKSDDKSENHSPSESSLFSGMRSSLFSGMRLYTQISSAAGSVDFTDYLKQLEAGVRRNWYAVMPESALNGDKGTVVVTFAVRQNGALSNDPEIEYAWHEPFADSRALDNAALEAIRVSAPFQHLPASFDGDSIELRCTFKYRGGARESPRVRPLDREPQEPRIIPFS